ncbi:MAG TPA: hypothetical protein VF775_06735 [Geobacteraceae bacterium]
MDTRRLVIFPVDQFYAIVGNITLPQDPYGISLTDILNERSAMTHRKGNHEHRPGRLFLSDAEFYAMDDNTRRICASMTETYVPVRLIRAAADVHPERYQGNAAKRQESADRVRRHRELHFALRAHAVAGMADALEVYRKSEHFVGLTSVTIGEEQSAAGHSLPEFLRRIGCPPPDFMAVNLRDVIHS